MCLCLCVYSTLIFYYHPWIHYISLSHWDSCWFFTLNPFCHIVFVTLSPKPFWSNPATQEAIMASALSNQFFHSNSFSLKRANPPGLKHNSLRCISNLRFFVFATLVRTTLQAQAQLEIFYKGAWDPHTHWGGIKPSVMFEYPLFVFFQLFFEDVFSLLLFGHDCHEEVRFHFKPQQKDVMV